MRHPPGARPGGAIRLSLCGLLAAACTGTVGTEAGGEPAPGASDTGESPRPPGGAPGAPGVPGAPRPAGALDAELAPASGLRRLTTEELANALRDLVGFSSEVSAVPEAGYAFDHDYAAPVVSGALVEGMEQIATEAAEWLMRSGNEAARDRVIGCRPAGAGDEACVSGFVSRFGRRALRRPLTDAEVTRYLALYRRIVQADPARGAHGGLGILVQTFLQHPEFVFRVELGTERAGGLHRLSPFEVASRLSFLLWGTTPDDALLDRAASGRLASAADVRAAATELLGSPRARARVARFHALWLGYERLPHPASLSSAMRAETDALVARVLFDRKAPWQDLFRSEETFLTDTLARHYGDVPPPGSTQPTWTGYGRSQRRGLLSHGSFLAIGGKFGDTSPTVRGKLIRERLFCEEIPDPDPDLLRQFNVDTDDPPASSSSPCKWDRYAEQREMSPACKGCHQLTDLIGFGFENYDPQGRYRAHDLDPATGRPLTRCPIRGEGEFLGVGRFQGPAGLSGLMGQVGARVNACVITQLYRFAMSRYRFDTWDQEIVARLQGRVGGGDFRFHELLTDLVSAEAFLHRRID